MLGQRIKELRTVFGWNQVQLAEKLNITKQTVSNWENENIQPSVEMLVRLAKLFSVSTDYLLGIDIIPQINTQGLPITFVAHLIQLVQDYRDKR